MTTRTGTSTNGQNGRQKSGQTGRSGLQRTRLMAGVSALVLGLGIGTAPAHAQLARLRQVLGGAVVPTAATTPPPVATGVRGQSMQQALAAQQANRAAIQSLRMLVSQAQSAAMAATRPKPTDGLSTKGLDPAVTKPTRSIDDPSGLATWQGALMPTQTVTDGKYNVTIKQTDSRALLSWNRFDVGAKTTLTFDQSLGGKPQTDWVVLNRVVDPNASPTIILGQIKASGTVLVINRNGVIFGNGAQVNTHSLLASSLDIGNFGRDPNAGTDGGETKFTGLSIKDRNTSYLSNGLLGGSAAPLKFDAMLTSSLTGTGNYSFVDPAAAFSPQVEGDVIIDRGASLTAASGGFLIVTAPHISNDGKLSAPDGQVSLQAGRAINYTVSTGATGSADADIRGLILRTAIGSGGSVVNSGLIDVPRGYISLGADLDGSVTNSGLIAATTSVSRNGVISLTAGHVTLSGGADRDHAGAIAILPDENGETVPQGTASEPPNFKSSRIDIGGAYVSPLTGAGAAGLFGPATVDFGANSLLFAPSATVSVGGRSSRGFSAAAFSPFGREALTGNVTVADGAMIDVGGIKDVQLNVSRNAVTISPLKGNELRDTPNYRDVKTDGSFTLNGKTVTLDVRRHGVRSDGVAWIGSPLIEAGSAASQIGVTAAELMTKGGSVTLKVTPLVAAGDAALAPKVSIASGAVINFSGGWVHYNAGVVRSSRLIRADGTLVDIADADPNGDYIGLADGYTDSQSRFGITRNFASNLLSGDQVEAAYDEGRDAGALIIGASTATVSGTLQGQAFAGRLQRERGLVGSASSAIGSDPRLLQASASELPSGGLLRIGSIYGGTGVQLGGDIVVAAGGQAASAPAGAIVLSDTQLSNAGLSALTLQTTGGVRFEAGSAVTLEDGGKLTVDAGRTIRFDGTVTARGGRIAARTVEMAGTVLQSPFAAAGSAFTTDDDVATAYADGAALPSLFDVVVTGTLDVSGQWNNDYLAARANRLPGGSAWTSGGSIALEAAPNVFVALGDSLTTASYAADLSGSLLIGKDALLNVASGGHVTRTGAFELTAMGGNISLINQTVYAAIVRTDASVDENSSTDLPIGGANQSVTFTPIPGDATRKPIRSALVVKDKRARVVVEASNLKGFGFGGGGTFKLVAPELTLGSATGGTGPHIGLDFLQQTGFGTLDIAAYKSRIFNNLFTNGIEGNSAFLETTQFKIGEGETLNLSQALLPNYLDGAQSRALIGLESGADVTSVVSAAVPVDAWDQRAATLKLGGLIELDVAKGGTITGAAGATIITPKLLNQGMIRLVGGSIVQRSGLPEALVGGSIGVRDATLRGNGLDDVLGGGITTGGHRQYDEKALTLVTVNGNAVTNGALFSTSGADRAVYFLGELDAGTGIRLDAGSVTDLSGGLVLNPRAPLVGGRMLRTGILYGGGSISTAAPLNVNDLTFYSDNPLGGGRFAPPRGGSTAPVLAPIVAMAFDAAKGATIDISGAAAALDIAVSGSRYARTAQWSNAGRLSVQGGGTLTGSTLRAFGGAAQADGGTLEWLRPILRQSDGVDGPLANVVTADWIAASGFSTMVARGSLALDGTIDLKLGKAFILSSADLTGSGISEPDLRTSVSLISNGDAVIAAPYVRLSSRTQSAGRGNPTGADSGSITFAANNIDLVGGITFVVPGGVTEAGQGAGSVSLKADQAIRLIGVASPVLEPTFSGLSGAVVSTGDLNFTAGQVYATTGTGNLQQLIEDRRNGTTTSTATPYLIASLADGGTVHFASNGGKVPDAPLSAGSWLRVAGAHIVQDGVLRAPLGLLEMGSSTALTITAGTVPLTQSVTFGAGSVTSVSGKGLNVPYGETTDLTEYYFKPNANNALTAAPVGELHLDGGAINIMAGATIDGQGGGDIFAFEFVSGTGGSRDVLSRTNTDSFSSRNGLQYADGRQVYAILPVSKAGDIAAYDPLFSADYGSGTGDIYGSNAGRTVWLDGGNGVAAGEYLLLPAHYALVPGALRLVENTDSAAPFVDGSAGLRDGSVSMGGTFGTAGTAYRESTRRAFTVQNAESFSRYSRIQTTSGTKNFNNLAIKGGKAAPRSPLDAARFLIRPTESFLVDGTFTVGQAEGGRGAQFDIAASTIEIRAAMAGPATPGVLTLTTPMLSKLNANSLLIGGIRSDNSDGTTSINVIGRNIIVAGGASLELPELILAVGGADSRLSIADGATIKATGTLNDPRTGNYRVGYSATAAGGAVDNTGIGAVLRVANGTERLVSRTSNPELTDIQLRSARLTVGNSATLSGTAVAFNSSGNVVLADTAAISAKAVSLGGSRLDLSATGLDVAVVSRLAGADRLTLQSQRLIALGGTLPDTFKDLVIDAPGFVSSGADVAIKAKSLTLRNSGLAVGGCSVAGSAACGSGHTITLQADTIGLGNGSFRLLGFEGGVILRADSGLYVEGKGTLAIDDSAAPAGVALTLRTPFVADRSPTGGADVTSGGAGYVFATTGQVTIDGRGLSAAPTTTAQSAGSTISFGTADARVASLTMTDARIRATAGVVEAYTRGDIRLTGTSAIGVPGFSTKIGSSTDPIIATAGSGTINLQSATGGIDLAAGTSLVVDNGVGPAGTLDLVATRGSIRLGSTLNGGIAATTNRRASILLDGSSLLNGDGSAFGLSGFLADKGHLFQGSFQIHAGTGDLALNAGQTLRAERVTLATDHGTITVRGTINTSGESVAGLKMSDAAYTAARVNGGDIALYGADGVTLASGARLAAGTSGYAGADSRQASGGNVTLGITSTDAALIIASGAVIDVAAARPGDRQVAVSVKDPQTLSLTTAYRQVAGDVGGTVTLRAPLIRGDTAVDVRASGTIKGASVLTLDAFKTFNLDALAAAGTFAGLTRDAAGIHLDAAATGKPNFLADTTAAGTLPSFIRNFTVVRADGGSLAGYRLRPEAVLTSTQTITLDSNLNLGAGTITDYAGALAAGLLTASPLGPDAAGNPRYEVVQGKEGELFSRFVDMTFRVGGKVTGEAGILTVRAGGDLLVSNSISDGFFAFHDRTDAEYISHQLGGGDRLYHPATQINCGLFATCDDTLLSYTKNAGKALDDDSIVVIDLTLPELGDQATPIFVHSPYSASANSVAANGTGNGIGIGELFPLVNGKPVTSSDIRLVAGAATGAADPLSVDRASRGSVIVSGEKSYAVYAKPGKNRLGGGVQLGVDDGFGTILYGNANTFLTTTLSEFVDPAKSSDFYTRLNWGSGDDLADTTRTAALAFFAGHRFVKESGEVVGVYASLGEVTQFLASDYGTSYTGLTRDTIGPIDVGTPIAYERARSYYRPLIRTGAGSIALAAAGNIDLVGSTKVTYRDETGGSRDSTGDFTDDISTAQVGSSAVYTAGTRLPGFGSANGTALTDSAERLDYIPSTQGILDWAPVQSGGGGSVSLAAGVDVIGRRDIWSEAFLSAGLDYSTDLPGYDVTSNFYKEHVGDASQRWRLGNIGLGTEIAVVAQLFSSGVGALAGGNVTVTAGRDVNDLTIALDNSVTTRTNAAGARVLATSGAGNLALSAGRDLLGGQVDIAEGTGLLTVGRTVGAAGSSLNRVSYDTRTGGDTRNLLRLRVADATIALVARDTVSIGGIGALGAQRTAADIGDVLGAAGFFSPIAGVSISTGGTLELVQNRPEQRVSFMDPSSQATDLGGFLRGYVLPPSLSLTSLSSDIQLGNGLPELLYPSQFGQLSLIAGGDISDFALSMSDANASDLPGAFTVTQFIPAAQEVQRVAGLGFTFGAVVGTGDDSLLRLLHDRSLLHAEDTRPVEIYAGGSLRNVQLALPKAATINAGGDLVNFYFEGQNLRTSDVTSIIAGRDITAETTLPPLDSPVTGRPYVKATNFILGGPGALSLQAGRDLGPFLNSVTVGDTSYGGGIRTIGNEANP
ncbi:MAG: filamentous hemagglutinin N-terminal domain-containing protein, partial [Novosphingobium sp.]